LDKAGNFAASRIFFMQSRYPVGLMQKMQRVPAKGQAATGPAAVIDPERNPAMVG
jgi:hypothetical protein